MQKGWTSEHFSHVRNAFERMESQLDSELVPVIKMKRGLSKCRKNGHKNTLIEETTYTFSKSICRRYQCDVCKKRTYEFIEG